METIRSKSSFRNAKNYTGVIVVTLSIGKNMADVASRGTSPLQLAQSGSWWNGPKWLTLPENDWPCQKTPMEPTSEANVEMQASSTRQQSVTVMLSGMQKITIDVSGVIRCEDFSDINQMITVMAYVSKFLISAIFATIYFQWNVHTGMENK